MNKTTELILKLAERGIETRFRRDGNGPLVVSFTRTVGGEVRKLDQMLTVTEIRMARADLVDDLLDRALGWAALVK